MDIFEFAMQMELDGKAFYENLAGKTRDKGLKEVLTMLAEEEQKHYEIFRRLKAGEGSKALTAGNSHAETLTAVKNIFVQMTGNDESPEFSEGERSVWAEALKIEEKSERFYREKASGETDSARKQLLNMIADEERNHIYLIDSVLTYMKFPDTFSESAQFKNFQSLEGH